MKESDKRKVILIAEQFTVQTVNELSNLAVCNYTDVYNLIQQGYLDKMDKITTTKKGNKYLKQSYSAQPQE